MQHLFINLEISAAINLFSRGYGTACAFKYLSRLFYLLNERIKLQFLAREAKRLGIPALLLDARDEAKPFYSKLGFEYRHSTPCAVLVDQLLA